MRLQDSERGKGRHEQRKKVGQGSMLSRIKGHIRDVTMAASDANAAPREVF